MVLESKRTKNEVKPLWYPKQCVVRTQQTLVGASCNGVNFGRVPIFSFFWWENLPPSAGDHHGSRDL